jgi:hypothetical protein
MNTKCDAVLAYCDRPMGHEGTHEAEARSTPAEPFDEAQAWADEAARNGDPEALTDA